MAKKDELNFENENNMASSEKLKALQAAMDKIEKSFGKGSIMKMGDESVEQVEVIPCQYTLQPVRKPGSMPITRFCPSGEASNSWRRFWTNTRLASSSACSLLCAANSVSMDDFNRRL